MIWTIQPELAVGATLIFFSAVAYFTRVLNNKGILLANATGLLAFFTGGMVPFLALVFFYIIAETATRVSRISHEKHEQRTESNIFGNCIVAIAALFFGQLVPFFGAVSAALSDTISSEIGMLSRKKPVLITSLKVVEPGTDGGVTLLGFSAAAVSAAAVGCIYFFMVNPSPKIFAIIVAAGVFGSGVDSVLGALFERKGLLDNTQVNLIASASGALLSYALYAIA